MMAWIWWVVAALVLGVIEMLSLDFIFLMLAGAALVTVIPALIAPDAIVLQILVFSITAIILLFLVRPIALKYVRRGTGNGLDMNLPIGRLATVVADVSDLGGRVKLQGEVWSAEPYFPGQVFATGQEVHVVQIDGATAKIASPQRPMPPVSPG